MTERKGCENSRAMQSDMDHYRACRRGLAYLDPIFVLKTFHHLILWTT
jgi:hypothetical protein